MADENNPFFTNLEEFWHLTFKKSKFIRDYETNHTFC